MIYVDDTIIENKLNKYNFLKRNVKLWNKNEPIVKYEFYHFVSLFLTVKNEYQNLFLNISQYKSFTELYSALKKIVGDYNHKKSSLFFLNKKEIMEWLDYNNLSFELKKDDTLKVRVKSLNDIEILKSPLLKKLVLNFKKYSTKYNVYLHLDIMQQEINYSLENSLGEIIYSSENTLLYKKNKHNIFIKKSFIIFSFLFLSTAIGVYCFYFFVNYHLTLISPKNNLFIFLFFSIFIEFFAFFITSCISFFVELNVLKFFSLKHLLFIIIPIFFSGTISFYVNHIYYTMVKNAAQEKQSFEILKKKHILDKNWNKINNKYYFIRYINSYDIFGIDYCKGKNLIESKDDGICFYKIKNAQLKIEHPNTF